MIAAPLLTGTFDTVEDALTQDVRGLGAAGVQLSGTWAGTVTFEASINGQTWVALNMVPSNSATAASTATANGAWSANVAGYKLVRARFSTDTSGAVSVTILASSQAGRY
jgi:hypothetical protein